MLRIGGEAALTAGQGLEPRYSGPKPDVLPLDDPAMCELYKKKAYFQLKKRVNRLVEPFFGILFGWKSIGFMP